MRQKSITIKDVAKSAGVSTATVSRALSRPSSVTESTRRAVLDAAERTGYQLNLAARNLRRQQTGTIVVLVPNLANPFFSHILAGIESEAAKAEKNVVVINTYSEHIDKAETLSLYLNSTRADGIIILDGAVPESMLEAKYITGVSPPVVFGCEWVRDNTLPSVRVDNRNGAAQVIAYLNQLGHTAIGHVTGPMTNVLAVERFEGMRKALRERNLPVVDRWTFNGDFNLAAGVEAARAFIALDKRPTAVFCACDLSAIGFMSELAKNGISVPQDVSVVGFDDIDIAGRYIPALTTIRQPRKDIGINAVRLLMNADADARDGNAPVVLPVQLIERDSTRRIP